MAVTIDGTNGIETNTDTGKIKVGASDDLTIEHSDTGNLSSITHSGAGKFDIVSTGDDLNIKSSENVVLMTNDTELGVYVIKNGAVKLYHDNALKFETTAAGVSVTGQVVATTNFKGLDNVSLVLGTGSDLRILHDGTDNVLTSDGGQSIRLVNHLTGGNETMGKFIPNGSVELYYNGAKKFYTSNDGIEVPDGSGFTNRTSGSNKGWYVQHGGTTVGRLFQNGTGPEGILELLNNGTQKILVNGDNGTYYGANTTIQALSSERRTKENITSIDDTKSWSTLKDIKLYNFSYKNDTNSDTHYGPIVDEIPTDMKLPTPNSDDVGVINTYNSELLLFRAYSTIKQLVAKVETLETKVAALEAA